MHTQSMQEKHICVGRNFPFSPSPPKNLGSTASYSILNTVGKRSIFQSTAKTNSEVYTFSRHKSYSGVGKNSGDYVHINMHKYSHDACANTLDEDMNANVCAHACVNACVNAHTRIHVCVDVYTYMHVHTIITHTS